MRVNFEDFKGKIFTSIKINDDKDEVLFTTKDGKIYNMLHEQDCCEEVYLEDIAGDINDLINTEILMAEEVTNSDDKPLDEYEESYTWTYYKFGTAKGYVTLRWYGFSNGYYSESVDIYEVVEEEDDDEY